MESKPSGAVLGSESLSLCPSCSHRYSVPSGVAAQGQGDVQEDDNVADGKDRQVLDGGAVDLILQRALQAHSQITDHIGVSILSGSMLWDELQELLTQASHLGVHRCSLPGAIQEKVEPGFGFDWN